MGAAADDDPCAFYVIIYSITMSLALGGIWSALCTFYLIWRLKLSNYYISIIKWLTACTLAYDVSFFLAPFSLKFRIAAQVLAALGGISTTLWVNLICFEVFYIVWQLVSCKLLREHFSLIVLAIMGTAGAFAVAQGVAYKSVSVSKSYYFFIMASIGLSFSTLLVTYCLLEQKRMKTSEVYTVVLTLVHKMKFYPIVQLTCRAGASWYQFQYSNYNWNEGSNWTECPNALKAAAFVVSSLLIGSSGIGYFVVFLHTQPKASTYFWTYIARCSQVHLAFRLTEGSGIASVSTDSSVLLTNNSINNSDRMGSISYDNDAIVHPTRLSTTSNTSNPMLSNEAHNSSSVTPSSGVRPFMPWRLGRTDSNVLRTTLISPSGPFSSPSGDREASTFGTVNSSMLEDDEEMLERQLDTFYSLNQQVVEKDMF